MAVFTYREVADEYFKSKNEEDIIRLIKTRFDFDSCHYKKQEEIRKKVAFLALGIKKRYAALARHKKRFFEKHKDWLTKELVLQKSVLQPKSSKSAKTVSQEHEETTDAILADLRKVFERVPEPARVKFQFEVLKFARNKFKQENTKSYIT